jgi:hypothetical protein
MACAVVIALIHLPFLTLAFLVQIPFDATRGHDLTSISGRTSTLRNILLPERHARHY